MMILRTIAASVTLLLATTFAQAETCGDLYAHLSRIDPRLGAALAGLQKIDPKLLKGEVTPQWKDFENLKKVIENVKAGKAAAQENGKLDELLKVAGEIAVFSKADPKLKLIAQADPAQSPRAPYQPTEYDLKRLYQKLIHDLNEELPSEIKIPIARLPFDTRKKALTRDAEALVRKVDERFQAIYKTTGFENHDDFMATLDQAGAAATRFRDILENEQIEVSIHRPEGGRWWIPKVGLQNQYTTKSSRGFMGRKGRQSVEAGYIGEKYDDYRLWDDELKPKYGTLYPKAETGLNRLVILNGYGQDQYIFKLDRIRDRMTFSLGDSLSRIGSMGIRFVGGGQSFNPEAWDQFFVPWKYRSLLAPELLRGGTDRMMLSMRRNPLPEEAAKKLERLNPGWDTIGSPYLEIQIFGPTTLDDVAIFEFANTPPDGEFLQELLKRGIKIRDGRFNRVKEWTPPAPAPEAAPVPPSTP